MGESLINTENELKPHRQNMFQCATITFLMWVNSRECIVCLFCLSFRILKVLLRYSWGRRLLPTPLNFLLNVFIHFCFVKSKLEQDV